LNLFSGIADVTYLHTVTTNVSQSRYTMTHLCYHPYITLKQVVAVNAFVSSKSLADEAASELPHASRCQTQAYAGHRIDRISFWPPYTIFQLS
jgi:hypothetical protein